MSDKALLRYRQRVLDYLHVADLRAADEELVQIAYRRWHSVRRCANEIFSQYAEWPPKAKGNSDEDKQF